MAFIRKNKLKPIDGKQQTSWTVHWRPVPNGQFKKKTFRRQALAKEYLAKLELKLTGQGDRSVTVMEGALTYLKVCQELVREDEMRPLTLEEKEGHINNHLADTELAGTPMPDVDVPLINRFLKDLREKGCSLKLVRKILGTVRLIWKQAVRDGTLEPGHANIAELAADPTAKRGRGRRAAPAEVPPIDHVKRAIAQAAEQTAQDGGLAHALVRTIVNAGLRTCEIRALKTDCLELGEHPTIRVARSADRRNQIFEEPKSSAGFRSIPISAETAQALRIWMMARPASRLDLVFPGPRGEVWRYEHLKKKVWTGVMIAAGLADSEIKTRIRDGKEERWTYWTPWHTPHRFRHVAASAWIASKAEPKWIQEKMGHASLQMTMDLYGHLWPSTDLDQRIANQAGALFD
ncbi:tyrosine-type recombinase/integrase [Hyphobacterium sp.]|uniref:tyrosine-type recombinase/integrase n=1 Tax=Hyphobacterium sp. TaxID=2004662 RepID=UPI003BA9AEC2